MTKINAVEVTINLVGQTIRENMEQIVNRIKSKGAEDNAHTHLLEVYETTIEGGMNDSGAIYISLEGDKLVFKGRGVYEHLSGEVNSEVVTAKYVTRKLELKESNILTYLNSVLFDVIHVMDDNDKLITLITFTPINEEEIKATGLNKEELLEGMLASYKEFLESPEKHITWEWVEGGLESTMSKVAALELFKNSIEKYEAEELEFVDVNTGELAPDTSINLTWRIVSAI